MSAETKPLLPNSNFKGEENWAKRKWLEMRHSPKTAVVVTFIAFALDLMLLTVVDPVLPDIVNAMYTYALNTTGEVDGGENLARDVGIINGAKPLTQVLLNPFFGMIISRIGHTIPLLAGFLCTMASTIGFAYSYVFWILFLCRCLQGIGSSLITISALTMLSSIYTKADERSVAMAVSLSGISFGLIFGFPFGSALYQFFGREAPFLAMAVITLIGAAIRFCLMPVNISKESKTHDTICDVISVLTDPYILISTGVNFWLCYAIGSIVGIGPVYLIADLKAWQWEIGVLFLVGAVVQTFFQYTLSPFSHKIGWWLLCFIGLILISIGVSTFPVMPSLWWTLVPQLIYSIGGGLVICSNPALQGHLADIRVGSRYGAVFALCDAGTNLGYFLGSLITGVLVNQFPFMPVFGGTGAVIFLLSFLCLILKNVPEITSRPVSQSGKHFETGIVKSHENGIVKSHENAIMKPQENGNITSSETDKLLK